MSNKYIYISIGTDCGMANSLKKYNLRFFSLPFDWVVTYNGVSDIIINKFDGYLNTNKKFNVSCNTRFVHNTFPKDIETMKRRIDRFLKLLNNEEDELIFIRKGHFIHHHKESIDTGCILKNDLQDCIDLHDHLKKNYLKLKFKIICILCCEKCFETERFLQTLEPNFGSF